jgi:hypothetical protein
MVRIHPPQPARPWVHRKRRTGPRGGVSVSFQAMATEIPDAVIELYKAGIDRTLLRENLRLTPDERVRNLQRLQKLAEAAREAGEAQRRQR